MAPVKKDEKLTQAAKEGAGLPETALVPADQNTALDTLPDFFNEDAGEAARENLTKEDVQIPRIAIAQKMSPEVEEGHAKFIAELKLGELFNSLTGKIYGKELRFIPLRVEMPRFIEFYPRDIGGGVKDLNVPEGDDRTKWTTDAEGKSVQPLATQFREYVVFLPDHQEVVALSMKGTSMKSARAFNGLRMTRVMPSQIGGKPISSAGKPAPLYAQVYKLGVAPEKNKKGSYFIFSVRNAGWTWELEREFQGISFFVKSQHDNLKNAEVINVHREPGVDPNEDTSFNPSELEQQGGGGAPIPGPDKTGGM